MSNVRKELRSRITDENDLVWLSSTLASMLVGLKYVFFFSTGPVTKLTIPVNTATETNLHQTTIHYDNVAECLEDLWYLSNRMVILINSKQSPRPRVVNPYHTPPTAKGPSFSFMHPKTAPHLYPPMNTVPTVFPPDGIPYPTNFVPIEVLHQWVSKQQQATSNTTGNVQPSTQHHQSDPHSTEGNHQSSDEKNDSKSEEHSSSEEEIEEQIEVEAGVEVEVEAEEEKPTKKRKRKAEKSDDEPEPKRIKTEPRPQTLAKPKYPSMNDWRKHVPWSPHVKRLFKLSKLIIRDTKITKALLESEWLYKLRGRTLATWVKVSTHLGSDGLYHFNLLMEKSKNTSSIPIEWEPFPDLSPIASSYTSPKEIADAVDSLYNTSTRNNICEVLCLAKSVTVDDVDGVWKFPSGFSYERMKDLAIWETSAGENEQIENYLRTLFFTPKSITSV